MKKLVLLLISACLSNFAFGQTNSFFNNDWTASSSWNYNPGLLAKEKVYVYLPVLGGFNAGIGHTGFSIDDAVSDNQLNITSLIEGLEPENHFLNDFSVDLFAIGGKFGRLNLRGGVSQKLESRATYTQSLLEFLWKGNGHPDLIGNRISMNNTGINGLAYLKYFVGGTYDVIPDNFSVGVNFNYYAGIASIFTERSSFGLTTDADDYTITADGSFSLLTSGESVFTDQFEANQFLPNPSGGNSGIGLDLGFKYQPSERYVVEASVLNLGEINWKDDTRNFELAESEISYSGFDLDELINSSDTVDVVQNFVDSITQTFVPEELSTSYKTGTNAMYQVRLSYLLSERDKVSFLFSNKNSFKTNFQSIGGFYSREFGTSLKLMGGVSLFRTKDLMIPIGLVFNAGPFQLGAQTGNILAVIKPTSVKHASLSFSLGLRFGKLKDEEIKE